METRREYKVFQLHEWREEEQYLSEMNNKGWKFVKKEQGKYCFESGLPKDYIYRITFGKQDAAVLQIADHWEFCGKYHSNRYWRHVRVEDLVSDNLHLKLAALRSRHRFNRIWVILLCFLLAIAFAMTILVLFVGEKKAILGVVILNVFVVITIQILIIVFTKKYGELNQVIRLLEHKAV